jgi:glycosyltransferase involved in cell wall biosynthesis
MRVYFDNVDIRSSSGPNSFGRKLLDAMTAKGHNVSTEPTSPEVQLSFIHTKSRIASKVALRLDGIYFNTRQDWESLNQPLRQSFTDADCVIYQSEFNRRLTEKFFGTPKKSVVIGNGTSPSAIEKISPVSTAALDRFDEVWCCSSSWRPHKRLKENIRYFLEMRPKNTGLVILGSNPDHIEKHPDVLYAGNQDWKTCISVYKRSKKFLHLAFLDHCPNVVVDARASGCDIVVSSSGGTKEIAGVNATVVEDLEWDLRPLDLYSPPPLDFSKTRENDLDSDIDISAVADKYIDTFESIMEKS